MNLQEAYQDKLAARLDQVDARMKMLKARANELHAEARIAYNRRIKELDIQRSQLGEQISALKAAGESASAEVKQGVDNALMEIENALQTTAEKLSE